MKLNDGSNFLYNILLGLGGLFNFFGIRSAIRDKKEIERLREEKDLLEKELKKCQSTKN